MASVTYSDLNMHEAYGKTELQVAHIATYYLYILPNGIIGHTLRSMSSSSSKIIKNAKKFYEKKNRHRNVKTDQNQREVQQE